MAGFGHEGHFPPLVGDPVHGHEDPWGATWVTLYGLKGRTLDGVPYEASMAGFSKIMTDQEIAELLSYSREAFAGITRPVKAADVARVRKQAGR